MEPNEKKNQQIAFRTTPEHRKKLDQMSLDLDLTLQDMILQALADYEGKIEQRPPTPGMEEMEVPRAIASAVRALIDLHTNPPGGLLAVWLDHTIRMLEDHGRTVKRNGTNGP